MKQGSRLAVLLLCTLAPLTAVAQYTKTDGQETATPDELQTTQPQQPAGEADEKKTTVPVYVPPRRGAPLVRVGAGSRGVEDGLPFIALITPEYTGLSSKSQPVLYWYLSADMKIRFEFALVTNTAIDPIVELVFDKVMPAGLHSLDLAAHGVTLQPDVSYQ